MTGVGGQFRRLAAGAAFFGLFFQLLLPVALATASDAGAHNRVLEICSVDGTRLVDFAVDGGLREEGVQTVELCTRCIVHAAFAPERPAGLQFSLAVQDVDTRFSLRPTPYHARAFISSDLAARGPPLA